MFNDKFYTKKKEKKICIDFDFLFKIVKINITEEIYYKRNFLDTER